MKVNSKFVVAFALLFLALGGGTVWSQTVITEDLAPLADEGGTVGPSFVSLEDGWVVARAECQSTIRRHDGYPRCVRRVKLEFVVEPTNQDLCIKATYCSVIFNGFCDHKESQVVCPTTSIVVPPCDPKTCIKDPFKHGRFALGDYGSQEQERLALRANRELDCQTEDLRFIRNWLIRCKKK